MKTNFVDYYKSRQISPVNQDISDLKLHFQKREALYQQLGITKNNISDRNVVEFGPRNGHNCLYTASFYPKKYVLADGNIVGLDNAKNLLYSYYPSNNIIFNECLIEKYSTHDSTLYSLVLCEGLIPFQNNPKKILFNTSEFAAEGGIITITTACSSSFFSEYLRRIYFHIKTKNIENLNNKEDFIEHEINLHLNTLLGRSRSTKDWMQDSFQPLNQRPSFSVIDALDVLAKSFTFLGTSLNFFTDFRWYKSIPFGITRNGQLKKCYLNNIHNFIDTRLQLPPLDPIIGKKILNITNKIEKLSWRYEIEKDFELISKEITDQIETLKNMLLPLNMKITIESINEFIHFLKTGNEKFDSFRSFWGKGQQYLSFVRNSSEKFN